MIELRNLSKDFDGNKVLKEISLEFSEGSVYGLVGANGAGKSTMLRIISGIYKQSDGEVKLDGEEIYDNLEAKKNIAFVPDDLFFLPQADLRRMADLYASSYESFDRERFEYLVGAFGLSKKKKISTFSKGMKRQAASILALSTRAKYILLDETFDGLDPVMRNLLKKEIYADVADNGTCVVITSHSLRELEDTCDRLALLFQGGVIFESDINDLQTSLVKVQIAFDNPNFGREKFNDIDYLDYEKHGSVAKLIVRGDREEIRSRLSELDPLILDVLSLSLEEIFIYELSSRGYLVDKEND
jgi:ABC-2 type transport system ATP-binding protein